MNVVNAFIYLHKTTQWWTVDRQQAAYREEKEKMIRLSVCDRYAGVNE